MKRGFWILLSCAVFGLWTSPLSTSGSTSAQSPTSTIDRDSTTSVPGDTTGGELFPPGSNSSAFDCDSTVTTDDLLLSAREMFLADNYTLAEMLYTCILRRDPTHLSAMLELSIVFETTGKLQHAKELLKRAAVLNPYDREVIGRNNEVTAKLSRALRSDAEKLLAKGAFHAALPKLSALLAAEPKDADLYYKKAQCYLELGDAENALREIDTALELQKEAAYFALRSEALKLSADREIGALTREAKRLLATGRAESRDRALAVVSQILTRDPEHRWAKRQFMLLTNGGASALANGKNGSAVTNGAKGAAAATAEQNQRTRAAGYATAAAAYVSVFTLGVVRTLERHLGLLIVALIVLIFSRSPLAFMIVRGFEPRHSLSGRLNHFNIQEILTMIHSQGRSGVLHVYAGAVKGRVYFGDGEIHHCTSGKSEGRDAVRLLLAGAKDGHFVFTKLPRSFRKTIDVPFSLVLMDIGDRSFLDAGNSPAPTPASASEKKSKMKSFLEKKS
jgi:tetratricopeptide (TPR) repeat protein